MPFPLPGAAQFEMRSALLCASSAERIFIISRLSRSAERSKRYFHGRGRNRKRQLQRRFLRKRGAAGSILALSGANAPALPKGEPLAVHANFISLPRPLPLGEVASRSDDGEGEPVPSIAANFTAVSKASPWGSWHGASRD